MASLSPEMLEMIKKGKNRYTRGGGKMVKFKEGKTTVRVIATSDKFWNDLGVHWIKPDLNSKPIAVGCKDHTLEQPCEICAAVNKSVDAVKRAADDDLLELIKQWGTKKTVVFIGIVRSGADASPEPQLIEAPPTVLGSMLAIIDEYNDSDINAIDPKEGVDFVVERSGSGKNTEYKVFTAAKSTPLTKEQVAKAKEMDVAAAIEKEYFKGEERKALNVIASVTGVTLALPPSASAGLLTRPSATVEDAEIVEHPAVESKPAPAAVHEPIEIIEPKKTEAPKVATNAVVNDNFGAALSDDDLKDIDSMLDELGDQLG